MSVAKFKYINTSGNVREGELRLEDYRTAEQAGMQTAALVNARFPDADPRYGTAFQQGMQSLGIFVKGDPTRGILPTTIREMLDGTAHAKFAGEQTSIGATIIAPSQQGTTPATRVFFPEVILQTMNEVLLEDYSPEMQIWRRMISATETIPTAMFTQPLINVTAPRAERSAPISQNALPRTLISITTSQYSKSIQTTSIGLQISAEAEALSSIDLVTTILAQQAEGERFAKLWEDIGYVVAGNTDAGQAALTPATVSGATSGAWTQTAWLTALYDPTRKVSYDSMICDLNAYLAIQNRTGRPQVLDATSTGPIVGNLGNYGLDVGMNLLNWSVGIPNVMLVPTGTIAADHVLLFDSRFALRQVVNSSAAYSATEEMVMQRSRVFRFDTGSMLYRLRDEAFQYVDFS